MEEKLYIEVGHLDDMIYDAVEKLVGAGMTAQEIANTLGKSIEWFKLNNKIWEFKPVTKKGTEDVRRGVPKSVMDRIRNDFTNGLSIALISEKYNLHTTTVYKYCGDLTKMKRLELTGEQYEEIKALYATGEFSYKELGSKYNVSHSTIRRIIIGELVYSYQV